MEPARRKREHDVARAHALGSAHGIRFDDPRRRARDVVVVGTQEPRVLGRLAADERRAGLGAAAGDAGNDVGDALGHDAAAGDVVGEEERTRTDHDDVVDDHADEVETHRVVLVDRLGDRDLRPDAVRARREQRARVPRSTDASNRPAKPPTPPSTSGPWCDAPRTS